jgi:hypothetical protein
MYDLETAVVELLGRARRDGGRLGLKRKKQAPNTSVGSAAPATRPSGEIPPAK